MKKYSKWALVLIIAGLLGSGIAQVGATMSAQYAAATQPAVAAPGCSGACEKSGGCAGHSGASGCTASKEAATTPDKQPVCGPGAGGCPEKEAGRACTDCSQHPNCAKNKASSCPGLATGEKCTDCSQHPGCPMSTTTNPAKSPAAEAKPAPK